MKSKYAGLLGILLLTFFAGCKDSSPTIHLFDADWSVQTYTVEGADTLFFPANTYVLESDQYRGTGLFEFQQGDQVLVDGRIDPVRKDHTVRYGGEVTPISYKDSSWEFQQKPIGWIRAMDRSVELTTITLVR